MNWHFGWTWFTHRTGYLNAQMKLTRLDATDNGVFGKLEFIDKTLSALSLVTLENHLLDIPTGTYKILLQKSNHFNRLVPFLQNVPNRTAIEIHYGNFEHDSHGCILVGMERDGNAIDSSQTAFEDLMNVIQKADDISITIV